MQQQKTFWGTSKNQKLDPKVCADSSWLLVFKNGLKKHSSLINDQVIDVWSWCKKRVGGGEEGTSSGLGFWLLCSAIWPIKRHVSVVVIVVVGHCIVKLLSMHLLDYWDRNCLVLVHNYQFIVLNCQGE